MTASIRVAVHGASGRMGRRIMALLQDREDLRLSAAITHEDDPHLGEDSGELAEVKTNHIPLCTLSAVDWKKVDVIIDFSLPIGLEALLQSPLPCPLVSGTTGYSEQVEEILSSQANKVPILTAPNFSTGITVLMDLAYRASGALDGYDVQITETHHRHKIDAPSGTAIALGEEIASARGHSLEERMVMQGGAQPLEPIPNKISMHSIREGEVIGEHRIWLHGPEESIQLSHNASSRDTFAVGALCAASWIHTQAPGRYTMRDVLGLDP
jgi:4-hydroxy-tetrahydrodipicolinate reductase